MNQKDNSSELFDSFIRIHKVITRGLRVGLSRGTGFANHGFPPGSIQQGFSDYLQSLVSVLTAHHLAEDGLIFPYLRSKHLSAPYGRLTANHVSMGKLLRLAGEIIPDMAGSSPDEGIGMVCEHFRRVSEIWKPHIETEESSFTSQAFADSLTPTEQSQLNADMGKFASEHSSPPELVLPFVLFNLAGADRAGMAKTIPGPVMQDLIMKEWRPRWAAMQPFLLD